MKKLFAFLLVAVMVVTLIPLTAMATEGKTEIFVDPNDEPMFSVTNVLRRDGIGQYHLERTNTVYYYYYLKDRGRRRQDDARRRAGICGHGGRKACRRIHSANGLAIVHTSEF